MGHEEGGSSSNHPELAAFVLALRGTPVTKSMLYLCDNQALLKAVKRWVGEGGTATLVGVLDADILLEAIEELRKRTTAGAVTFLVKMKAHRREEPRQKGGTVSYENRKSTWNSRVRKAIRRGSAGEEV